MERSEPALVPEWLKNSGNNSSNQHSAPSSSQSDDHATTLPTRNRLLTSSVGDNDSPRSSSFLDRSSSSYFNRSSGRNGSVMHERNPSAYPRSYSSSGRSHRDRDWDSDFFDFYNKERSGFGDRKDRYFTPSGGNANPFVSRAERDALRRSRSSLSGKRSELRPRRVEPDFRNSNLNDRSSSLSPVVGSRVAGSTHKAAFERDFPSLGAEERQGASESGGASPSSLSSAIQSLPMGSSSVIGRDGWTSALAEVPATVGSNSLGISSPTANSATLAPSTTTGLNMAETLAQAPLRARTAPQLSVETQRLEELALKQSRQLIPMTPLMAKTSVLNSEKQKPKAAGRNEMNLASKIALQQTSSAHLVNHSQLGGNVKADMPKPKLLVLKPAREKNGVASTAKDSSSPTNVGVGNITSAVVPSVVPCTVASAASNNQKHTATEHKPSIRPAMHSPAIDKHPTLSQAQSRSDFFNLMRKKTSSNPSPAVPDPTPVMSSNISESSGELFSAPVTPKSNDAPLSDLSCPDWSIVNGTDMGSNGDVREESERHLNNGQKHPSPIEVVYSDEEEVAFLRSLGWEENAGEEEGLTEEEINAFYKKLQLKPSLKINRGILQQKLPSPLKSQVGSFDSVCSGLGSSDSDSDA